jgi:hypothetical protein
MESDADSVPTRVISTEDCTSLPLREIGAALRAWAVSRCSFGRAYYFDDQSEPSRTVGPKTAFGCDVGGGRRIQQGATVP